MMRIISERMSQLCVMIPGRLRPATQMTIRLRRPRVGRLRRVIRPPHHPIRHRLGPMRQADRGRAFHPAHLHAPIIRHPNLAILHPRGLILMDHPPAIRPVILVTAHPLVIRQPNQAMVQAMHPRRTTHHAMAVMGHRQGMVNLRGQRNPAMLGMAARHRSTRHPTGPRAAPPNG
jgi:hypothetical protein